MSATINARSTLFKGKIYSLVAENITLQNGITTDVEYIQHPGAAAIVPMPDESHVILVHQYRHALRKFIWEIPAGTLHPSESAIACARRELMEETGYVSKKWHALGEITPVPGYSNEHIFIFLTVEIEPASQHLDQDELMDVHAVDFNEALNMVRRGQIQDGKTISGLFLAQTWLQK